MADGPIFGQIMPALTLKNKPRLNTCPHVQSSDWKIAVRHCQLDLWALML